MSEQTWQGELETVEKLLGVGDVAHALTHLGSALALAPWEERVHARIEAAAVSQPLLELLPQDTFIGTALLKGFLLRRAGRVDEALVLVAQLAEQFPARRFESLLALWLVTARAEGKTPSTETFGQLTRLLMSVGQSTIGVNTLHAGERELLSGYEALADAAVEALPGDDDLRCVASGVYRRLGLHEKSLRVVTGLQGYFPLLQRGLVQRASRDFQAALQSFQAASRYPETGLSDVLEQVRCHLALREFRVAGELLETVSPEPGVELDGMKLLAAKGHDGDVLDVLDRLRRMRGGSLAAPGDATVNTFREHRAKFTPGSTKLKLAINGWESPSNHLLAALFSSGTTDLASVDFSMNGGPVFERDPAATVRGAAPSTWHKVGDAVVQVSPPPSEALREQLASVITADLETMWSKASALAASLTTTPAELMAAMVHPPTHQPFLEALPEALYRYQVATALVLAQLPLPWPELKRHFESLLYGPVDWTSAAAVSALAEKARRDATCAREAVAMVNEVVNDLLPHTCEPRAFALLPELNALTGVSWEAKEKLRGWFKQQFPPEEKQPPAAPRAAAPSPSSAPTTTAPGIPGWVWLVGALAIVGALIAFAR